MDAKRFGIVAAFLLLALLWAHHLMQIPHVVK